MRKPSSFRQTDVTRLMKAAKAAGVEVRRVEVDRDGKIIIVTEKAGELEEEGKASEWDRI